MAIKSVNKPLAILLSLITLILIILFAYNSYERCGCEKAIEFARPHITRMCEKSLGAEECSKLEFVCGYDIEMSFEHWLVYGNVPNSDKQFGGYILGNGSKGFRLSKFISEAIE